MAPNRIKMLEELGVTGLTVKSRTKRGCRLKNYDILARYISQNKKEPSRSEVVEGKPLGTWLASQKVKSAGAIYQKGPRNCLPSSRCLPSEKSAPSWTWPGSDQAESVTIPRSGTQRSKFFTNRPEKSSYTTGVVQFNRPQENNNSPRIAGTLPRRADLPRFVLATR